MLVLDKIFIKMGMKNVEISLSDWMDASGPKSSSYQFVYTANADIQSGETITLPEGKYDPISDVLIINQEGFMLIPNMQYTESGNTITFLIDIPNGTNIHILIFKLNKKFS